MIDEYTRECLAIRVARQIRSEDVLELLAELSALWGTPEHLRSDNGPEFCARAVREWLERVGVKTLFIEPGSPWENGYNESFNGKLRGELLNRENFYTLRAGRELTLQVVQSPGAGQGVWRAGCSELFRNLVPRGVSSEGPC